MTIAFTRAFARRPHLRPTAALEQCDPHDLARERLERLQTSMEAGPAAAEQRRLGLVTADHAEDATAAPWEVVDRGRAPRGRWKLIAGTAVPLLAALVLIPLLAGRGGHRSAPAHTAAAKAVSTPEATAVANPDAPLASVVAAPSNARETVLRALQDAQSAEPQAAAAGAATTSDASAAAPAAGGWARSTPSSGTGGPVVGAAAWQRADASPSGPVAPGFTAAPQAAAPARPGAVIGWPASGPITSYYGPSHPLGIDIGINLGTPLRAAAAGIVSFVGGDPCCSYGYYVDIDHGNGVMTRYGHMIQPSFLRVGQPVRTGDVIGYSGSTGFSTGPHLHFEVRLHGVPVNPLLVLP